MLAGILKASYLNLYVKSRTLISYLPNILLYVKFTST